MLRIRLNLNVNPELVRNILVFAPLRPITGLQSGAIAEHTRLFLPQRNICTYVLCADYSVKVNLLNKMYSKFLSAFPNMNHFAWIRIFVILANAAGFATCQIEHFNSEFSKFVTFSS